MTIDVLMTAANVRAVVICRYATFMNSLPKIYSKFDGLWCVCYLTIQAQGLGRDWVAPRSLADSNATLPVPSATAYSRPCYCPRGAS